MSLKPLRTLSEKIIIQRFADLEKQRHRDPFLVENLVKVLGCAVHLLRQPDRRATLSRKLLLDDFPDVEIFWCRRFVFHAAFPELCLASNKIGVPCLSLIPIEGVWKASG